MSRTGPDYCISPSVDCVMRILPEAQVWSGVCIVVMHRCGQVWTVSAWYLLNFTCSDHS